MRDDAAAGRALRPRQQQRQEEEEEAGARGLRFPLPADGFQVIIKRRNYEIIAYISSSSNFRTAQEQSES